LARQFFYSEISKTQKNHQLRSIWSCWSWIFATKLWKQSTISKVCTCAYSWAHRSRYVVL